MGKGRFMKSGIFIIHIVWTVFFFFFLHGSLYRVSFHQVLLGFNGAAETKCICPCASQEPVVLVTTDLGTSHLSVVRCKKKIAIAFTPQGGLGTCQCRV